jgi:hypothetical protein
MLVFKFIQVFVLLSALFVMIVAFYRFIQENREHSKRMKKIEQWSQFHGQLMEWSKEIVDDNVRANFISHCVHKLIQTGNDKFDDLAKHNRTNNNLLNDWSIDEEKQKVCNEWGQHIPSLLQEIRDKKINQIL